MLQEPNKLNLVIRVRFQEQKLILRTELGFDGQVCLEEPNFKNQNTFK